MCGLQFHFVTEDWNVDEWHIKRNYCKGNSFQVTTDLLNSENLKIAIVHLCNELQVCNFTMLQLTQLCHELQVCNLTML